jgi:hypothetical protein
MPGYNFAWTNFPPGLLRELARYLGLDLADPAVALRQRYGARPTEDFIRLARPVLERTWLARDPTALAAVVKSLWRPTTRDGYLVPSGRQRQLDWLASRSAMRGPAGPVHRQWRAHHRRYAAVRTRQARRRRRDAPSRSGWRTAPARDALPTCQGGSTSGV